MDFPQDAVERAMTIRDVLVRAISGQYSWVQAANILGMSPRTLRRWRWRMDHLGQTGLIDMRRGRPSPRKASRLEVQRIIGLYRERYQGFNCRHFHQIAVREHEVALSYSLVKQVLQAAGLLRKGRARGRHRRRRDPRPRFGELLHIDGSNHPWLALVAGERQTMIAILDDATRRLLYAQLFSAESTFAVMVALRAVIARHGIPAELYSDRASWAFFTPKAGEAPDRDRLTQVGRALRRLGIHHIPSFSPQARGRSERLNRTLQGRVVNELRLHGIRTLESANRYLHQRFMADFNVRFSRPPLDPESAFVPLNGFDLEQVLCHEEERTVGRDNTIMLLGAVLQIEKQKHRRSCAGLRVLARRHLDGRFSVWLGPHCLGSYDRAGRLMSPMGPAGPGRDPATHPPRCRRSKPRPIAQILEQAAAANL